MKLYLLVGMPGSGKSACSECAKEMGYPIIRMGDCVLNEAKEKGVLLDETHFSEFATRLRNERGNDFSAYLTVDWIRENCSNDDTVFVDGCRSMREYLVFRNFLKFVNKDFKDSDIRVFAVLASKDKRYSRISKRGRPDNGILAEMEARDRREISWGQLAIIDFANLKITNYGDNLEEFKDTVKIFVKVDMGLL